MNNIILVTCMIFLLFPGINAQDILLEREVDENMFNKEFGQNKKKFGHLFMDLEFIIDESPNDGLDINLIRSNILSMGYRYKYKLNGIFSVGFELAYLHYNFNIKQNDAKIFINSVLHDKEQLILNNFRMSFYQRFNYGNRGNFIGNFIDLGAYINWTFLAKHQMFNNNGVPEYLSGETEIIHRNLKYINPFHFGVTGRVGFNRYAVVVNYRLSNILNLNHISLPSLSVGLQLGLH